MAPIDDKVYGNRRRFYRHVMHVEDQRMMRRVLDLKKGKTDLDNHVDKVEIFYK